MTWLARAFLHYTGSDNVSGRWYGFWSGFGGDLGILAAIGYYLRRHNCHARGCWRIGLRAHEDGLMFCHHHHPAER
jgi:hypothetical protein